MSQSTCSFQDCNRNVYGYGLCHPHWQQKYRRGQELRPLRTYGNTLDERFWVKVVKSPDCWEWTGAKRPEGHGVFRIDSGGNKNIPAHKYSYETLIGPVPDGLVLDHLCRNTSCVNPSHLEPVTQGENVLRGDSPMAHNLRKTHCKYSHEFTPENTYLVQARGKTQRHCRECSLRRSREQSARKRKAKNQPHV